MQSYRPSANSAKKVFIAHPRFGKSEATPVTIGSSGEAVQFVDSPAVADEEVRVFVGGRALDRASAIKLSKAALKEQKREEKGKKSKNVLDSIVADFEAPAPKRRKAKREGGFSWRNWALLGCVGWIALSIVAGVPLGILMTPVMGPLMGWIAGGFLAVVFSFNDY